MSDTRTQSKTDLMNEITVALLDQLFDLYVERAVERATERVLAQLHEERAHTSTDSPYMTIREAANYFRCSRQRIDDLLSQRRLTRYKDGTRTLVSRNELEAHLRANGR